MIPNCKALQQKTPTGASGGQQKSRNAAVYFILQGIYKRRSTQFALSRRRTIYSSLSTFNIVRSLRKPVETAPLWPLLQDRRCEGRSTQQRYKQRHDRTRWSINSRIYVIPIDRSVLGSESASQWRLNLRTLQSRRHSLCPRSSRVVTWSTRTQGDMLCAHIFFQSVARLSCFDLGQRD